MQEAEPKKASKNKKRKRKQRTERKSKPETQVWYHIRQDQIRNYWAGESKKKKKKKMHECNRHEYAISKRKEFKAW
jgi:hypothetical protein